MEPNDETLYQSNSPEQMNNDMTPPPIESSTASPADDSKEEKNNSWKKVVIGGTTGILLGGAAMYATNAMAASETYPSEEPSQNHSQEIQQQQQATIAQQQATIAQQQATIAQQQVTIAQQQHPDIEEPMPYNPYDDLSFDEAFAAARAEVGPGGVFHWHGGVYGTFYAEEWSAMSEDERMTFYQATQDEILESDGHSFAHHIDTPVASPMAAVHSDDVAETPAKDNSTLQTDDDSILRASQEEESGVKTIADVVEKMDDVHLVREDFHDDGSVIRVYNVDDINAVGFDIDGNGQNDVAAVDMNHNNDLDQGEMVRTDTMEPLDLNELAAAAESESEPYLHDASYDNSVEDNSMPDYMDDASVDL